MNVLKLNGIEYDKLNVMSLTRNFVVTDTDNTGRAISGDMDRDIIGTFYNYTIEIEPSVDGYLQYDNFYEVISDPNKPFHVLENVPYGQSVYSFLAYISRGNDKFKKINGNNTWSGLSIDFIAKSPKRRAT